MMPGGMNGFELASTVRQDYPGLPIVLTTGFSDAADAARTKGVEVVAKPYDPEKVAAHLMQLIASSRGSTLH
jgi:CheY-like chemotaxis protein